MFNRRDFLKKTALFGAVAAVAPTALIAENNKDVDLRNFKAYQSGPFSLHRYPLDWFDWSDSSYGSLFPAICDARTDKGHWYMLVRGHENESYVCYYNTGLFEPYEEFTRAKTLEKAKEHCERREHFLRHGY